MITHEPDNAKMAACGAHGALADPGGSSCGNVGCRTLRAKRKLLMIDPQIPADAAHLYAVEAYRKLRERICPGGNRHEGLNSSAEYCDTCLVEALASAFEAGSRGQ